jgi:adenylosuccinate lyase
MFNKVRDEEISFFGASISECIAELPFMATETILMAGVEAGGSRGDLHEVIREHSMEAGRQVKEFGKDNDLLSRIKADPAFAAVAHRIDEMTDPNAFVGRSPQQVEEYIREEVDPLIKRWSPVLLSEKESADIAL